MTSKLRLTLPVGPSDLPSPTDNLSARVLSGEKINRPSLTTVDKSIDTGCNPLPTNILYTEYLMTFKTIIKLTVAALVTLLILGCGILKKGGGPMDSSLPTSVSNGVSEGGLFNIEIAFRDELKAGSDSKNTATVTITDSNKDPYTDRDTIQIMGFHPEMPMMGHGTNETSQVITAIDGRPGKFKVTGVQFMMAGKAEAWRILVGVKVNGVVEKSYTKLGKVK